MASRAVECETPVHNTARVRRKRRKRAAVPVLPEELILWEILVRLPAKPLLRCRAVCRSWRRVTSDDAFLLAHHRHQPSLPLVSSSARRTRDSGDTVHATVDAFDLRRSPAERRTVLGFDDYNSSRRQFTVHASCDGLLLLSLSNYRSYVCNPATRQWCGLPAVTGGNVFALYHHRPSGEYRVLYCRNPDPNIINSPTLYYVLTVGSSEAPRCVGMLEASPSMEQVTGGGHHILRNHPPVLLHDCLHWDPGSIPFYTMYMAVFDTVAESFRWMRSPTASRSAKLLEMEGRLGLSHIDDDATVVETWVLQDYGMEVWSLKHRIELPVVEMNHVVKTKYFFRAVVVPGNLDVLVYCWPLYLFHCDSKGKLVNEFDSVIPGVIGVYFKESLVRHVFLYGYRARARQPRFFRGL